jgi:Cyclopropane fatty acid synthase and related methyltransferases
MNKERLNPKVRAVLNGVTPLVIMDRYRRFKTLLLGRKLGRKVYRLRSGEYYFSGKSVGMRWDEMGLLQFKFLVENGLQPHHRLLDVGCGSLRGGVHFIRYLDDGNYYGVDKQQLLLDAAVEVEMPRYSLEGRIVHLLNQDDFDFSRFNTTFDYALAQSVFTHLTWNSILRCLVNVEKVLAKDGKFYSTFFEATKPEHRIEPIKHQPGGCITYPDRDPFHYEFDVFIELADRVGLKVKYLGDWGHPKNQKMMVFSR